MEIARARRWKRVLKLLRVGYDEKSHILLFDLKPILPPRPANTPRRRRKASCKAVAAKRGPSRRDPRGNPRVGGRRSALQNAREAAHLRLVGVNDGRLIEK